MLFCCKFLSGNRLQKWHTRRQLDYVVSCLTVSATVYNSDKWLSRHKSMSSVSSVVVGDNDTLCCLSSVIACDVSL